MLGAAVREGHAAAEVLLIKGSNLQRLCHSSPGSKSRTHDRRFFYIRRMFRARFRESKTVQRVVFFAFGSYLLLHFALTLVHTLPDQVPTYPLRGIARTYMVPFFHQGWALFAPDVPQQQFDLDYRFRQSTETDWSDWQQADDLRPLTSHPRAAQMVEKMLMLVARDLGNNLTFDNEGLPDYELITTAKPYFFAVYYTVRRHELIHGDRPEAIQLRLDVRHTLKPEWSRIANPPEDRSFTFPPFEVTDE